MNNLEEKVLINKLYEASGAGVIIRLIVRSICCLKPGVQGLSENITVTRIVDRYLEHGRIFVFHNNGSPELYMGSADWMNRNIYRRIEVCFPVYDETIKKQVLEILQLQLQDNGQAVEIDQQLNNVPVPKNGTELCSQEAIYHLLGRGNN
jgi:polyphosphate kinase